jgi:hypothetical protein
MPSEPDLRPARGFPCRLLLTDRAEAATTSEVAKTVHLPVEPYQGLGVALLLDDGQLDLVVTAACRASANEHLITLDLRTPANLTSGDPT